jgi:hypothetical protein
MAWLLPACGGWLSVNRVSSAQKKPNNAWVFFSVERIGDQPVTGLAAEDFTVYEDGSPVPKEDSRQILQSPDSAAARATLLLLDLSGTTTTAAPDALVDAAKGFVERLGKGQRVGIYAYDGDEKLHPLVPFTDKEPPPAAYEAVRRFRAKDLATNLHGAVVEGLRELRRVLDRDRRSIRFGTLVVAAQGIDRANRVSVDDMHKEWDDDRYKLYEVMAVGAAADRSFLDEAGRDAVEVAPDRGAIKDALDRAATRIESHASRYYLLSFCTTARKGARDVRIEAHARGPDASGSLRYTFNADGLGPPPDCDAKTPAAFEPEAAEPKEKPADDAKPAGKRPAKGGGKQLLIDSPPPEKP